MNYLVVAKIFLPLQPKAKPSKEAEASTDYLNATSNET